MSSLVAEPTDLVEMNLPTSLGSVQILTCVPSALTFDRQAERDEAWAGEPWEDPGTGGLTHQPGHTVGVDLSKHEAAVILQVHPSQPDGRDRGWTAAVEACRKTRAIRA